MKKAIQYGIISELILVIWSMYAIAWSQDLSSQPDVAAQSGKPQFEKARETLRKVEADNAATNKKLADYILSLQNAARGNVDADTKDILDQTTTNQNLRAILDHLRKFPADQEFMKQLYQHLSTHPTQDPAQKLIGIIRDYKDSSVPADVEQKRNQLLERLAPELRREMVTITAKGTGRTTGHIADLSVTNSTQSFLNISPQAVFIPSDGKYQPYVGTIPGTVIPPGTTTIPVDGYCVDVHTPPVPSGNPMPPVDTWIPVGDPDNIPEGDDFPVIPATPVPPFVPEDIPDIISTPGFTAVPPDPDQDIIITWPGTDIPVGGTMDPKENPEVFAPVIVKVMEEVISAAESITESEILTTPFSPDPPRQIQSSVQQVVWIYASVITGDEYTRPDFKEKVYDQFEDNSGKAVTTLPREEKEELDSGVDEFWDVFTAVGVEAKVISETSPGIDLDPAVLATVRTPQCACESISYDLEVKRGGVVVHSENHTTPDNPKVAIAGFALNDVLEVKLSNISANCHCDEAECLFYPAESTNPNSPDYTDTDRTRPGKVDIEMENDPAGETGSKGNNNCQNKDKTFNDDETEYTFTLETRDEGTNLKAVFQKLRIKCYCELDDCRRKLCAKYIQLNFVTAN